MRKWGKQNLNSFRVDTYFILNIGIFTQPHSMKIRYINVISKIPMEFLKYQPKCVLMLNDVWLVFFPTVNFCMKLIIFRENTIA